MKKIIISISIIFTSISFNVNAQTTGSPVYECSPEELIGVMDRYTQSLRMPSPLPQASQVQDAILEEKVENPEEGACAGLFSFSRPSFDFKGLLDGFSMPDGGFAVREGLRKLREKMTEAFCSTIDSLGGAAKEEFKRSVRMEYGVDLNDVRGSSWEVLNRDIDDNLYDKYGSDSRYFRDPERFGQDERQNTEGDVRRRVRGLWD